MPGGLLALLDDVALIARAAASSVDDVAGMAAKTSTKAAGVVIDDAAVTPQYVSNVSPARELPMIWKITKGSLRNKLLIILPIALLLNAVAPFLLVPILMIGGTYLCFEGAEKIWEKLFHSNPDDAQAAAVEREPESEDVLVKRAITTDLILSAEIMIIALDEVASEPLLMEFLVLLVVGIGITIAVYGAVALLVKIDDIGLRMIEKDRAPGFGRALVNGMPYVLQAIGIIGTVAMLWVGGHLIIRGLHEVLHFSWPHDVAVRLAEAAGGGALGWLADTTVSLIVGLIAGFIVLFIVEAVRAVLKKKSH